MSDSELAEPLKILMPQGYWASAPVARSSRASDASDPENVGPTMRNPWLSGFACKAAIHCRAWVNCVSLIPPVGCSATRKMTRPLSYGPCLLPALAPCRKTMMPGCCCRSDSSWADCCSSDSDWYDLSVWFQGNHEPS